MTELLGPRAFVLGLVLLLHSTRTTTTDAWLTRTSPRRGNIIPALPQIHRLSRTFLSSSSSQVEKRSPQNSNNRRGGSQQQRNKSYRNSNTNSNNSQQGGSSLKLQNPMKVQRVVEQIPMTEEERIDDSQRPVASTRSGGKYVSVLEASFSTLFFHSSL